MPQCASISCRSRIATSTAVRRSILRSASASTRRSQSQIISALNAAPPNQLQDAKGTPNQPLAEALTGSSSGTIAELGDLTIQRVPALRQFHGAEAKSLDSLRIENQPARSRVADEGAISVFASTCMAFAINAIDLGGGNRSSRPRTRMSSSHNSLARSGAACDTFGGHAGSRAGRSAGEYALLVGQSESDIPPRI